MDQADDELRDTVRNIWPLQAKKMLDLLIPRREGTQVPTYVLFIYFFFFFFFLKISSIQSTIDLFAELGKDKLSVGKIYACLLIVENWRTTRFGQIQAGTQVSFLPNITVLYCRQQNVVDDISLARSLCVQPMTRLSFSTIRLVYWFKILFARSTRDTLSKHDTVRGQSCVEKEAAASITNEKTSSSWCLSLASPS